MIEPRCIRYFKTKELAEKAKMVVEEGGFEAYVAEDTFRGLTLEELNIPPRYKLYVEMDEIKSVAKYLAEKIKRVEKG